MSRTEKAESERLRGRMEILIESLSLEEPDLLELVQIEVDIEGLPVRRKGELVAVLDVCAWDHTGFQLGLTDRELQRATDILLSKGD